MNKSEFIWMNGELVPWDEAKVHVLSHTLHYGKMGAIGGGPKALLRNRFGLGRLVGHFLNLRGGLTGGGLS